MLLVLVMASVVFTSFLVTNEARAQSFSDRLDKAFEKVSEKNSKAAEKIREADKKFGGCGFACG